MDHPPRSQPSAAEVAFVNATALLKRRFEVDPLATGIDASGDPLPGDDRLLRIEFDDAVGRGTKTRDVARAFFQELDDKGWSVPVAALLINSSLFVTGMAALPEARQTCAKALLGPHHGSPQQ